MDHALTPRSPRLTRRFLGAVGSVALMLGVYLAAALPVAACDCMGLEPMASYAGSRDRVIFSGTVQAPEPAGVPVLVSTWFQGDGAAGLVLIQGDWGLGGASCETPLPPAGTEWIFVASRRDTGELDVNLCTPHAALGTDAGQAMLADAVATFGDGTGGGGGGVPGNPGAGGPGEPGVGAGATEPPAAPEATPGAAANGAADALPAAILGVTVVGGAGLLVGVALLARRPRRDDRV